MVDKLPEENTRTRFEPVSGHTREYLSKDYTGPESTHGSLDSVALRRGRGQLWFRGKLRGRQPPKVFGSVQSRRTLHCAFVIICLQILFQGFPSQETSVTERRWPVCVFPLSPLRLCLVVSIETPPLLADSDGPSAALAALLADDGFDLEYTLGEMWAEESAKLQKLPPGTENGNYIR